jgi:hypothetical protein
MERVLAPFLAHLDVALNLALSLRISTAGTISLKNSVEALNALNTPLFANLNTRNHSVGLAASISESSMPRLFGHEVFRNGAHPGARLIRVAKLVSKQGTIRRSGREGRRTENCEATAPEMQKPL